MHFLMDIFRVEIKTFCAMSDNSDMEKKFILICGQQKN